MNVKTTGYQIGALKRQLDELLYQRRWLVEQLAGAWGMPEEDVLARLQKDSAAHMGATA